MDNPAAFVLWLMLGVFLTLCGVFYATSSHADELDSVKASVDGQMSYRYYTGFSIPSGTEGNCFSFAIAYMGEAMKRGLHRDGAEVRECKLADGTGHAYYRTYDGRALDVRHRWVVSEAEVGCVP